VSHEPGASSDAKREAAAPKLNWDAVLDVSLCSCIWFSNDQASEHHRVACAVFGGVD